MKRTVCPPSPRILAFFLFLAGVRFLGAQNICNNNGNLMIFTNYDGGTLTINVNQNITNLKIGICSYEACVINLTGPFVTNVTEVRYAGYNSANNNNCAGGTIPTTTINGAGTASTSIIFAPNSTLSNSNGYGSIICGYSCDNGTYQGGCNTVDQVEAYFLGYFSGSTLFAHRVQYGCWSGTQSVSVGGDCCPVPALLPGTVSGSQTLCAGQTPTALTSATAASGGLGTITYTWQSSTTSQSSGYSNISSANGATYQPGSLAVTTWYRRATSTPSNSTVYSNVIAVTVYPLPTLNLSTNAPLCEGELLTLSASGAQIYGWQNASLFGSGATFTSAATSAHGGTWTLTAISSAGCLASATINVLVYPVPSVFVLATPFFACEGDTVVLTGSGANSYHWEPGSLTGSVVIVTPTTSTAYTMTGTDQNGCEGKALVMVGVDPKFPTTMIVSDSVICAGRQVTLTAIGASSFMWFPGALAGNSIVVTPSSSVTYTAHNTDQGSCLFPGKASLTVNPSPTITASANRTLVCLGESATLTASANGSLLWLGPLTSTGFTVKVTPSVTTTYTALTTATNSCTAVSAVKVSVDPCTGVIDKMPGASLITIMPNPSAGAFIVRSQIPVTLYVLNGAGKQLRVLELTTANGLSASVTDLPPGIYLVRRADGALAGKASVIR